MKAELKTAVNAERKRLENILAGVMSSANDLLCKVENAHISSIRARELEGLVEEAVTARAQLTVWLHVEAKAGLGKTCPKSERDKIRNHIIQTYGLNIEQG